MSNSQISIISVDSALKVGTREVEGGVTCVDPPAGGASNIY